MWDCLRCGCQAIAASVSGCPQCGRKNVTAKPATKNGNAVAGQPSQEPSSDPPADDKASPSPGKKEEEDG